MNSIREVTLEDIAESVDYGVTASAELNPVGPKFLRITDIQDGKVDWETVPYCQCDERESRSSRLIPGDIVFARTGATTGKSYLIRDCPAEAVFASYLIRVRLTDDVEPRYISHFFQGQQYWSQITSVARGAAQPGVNATTLKKLHIPLPGIEQQRRIADILDRADALRAKRRAALARLDELTQAIFVEMFGSPISNPKGWAKRLFEEACPTRLGKMLDQKKQSGQHARKYIRNANVQWFHVDVTDVYEMDFDLEDRQLFRLKNGDLLMCEGGEPGRAAIWHDELPECYYQKALHRGRPNPSMATAEYLAHLLWFLSKGGGLVDHITSATIAHLTSEKLKAIKIPLPPLTLQKNFSDRLAALERVRCALQKSASNFDSLFASLQDRAFRGAL